jgi:hypothetical protein
MYKFLKNVWKCVLGEANSGGSYDARSPISVCKWAVGFVTLFGIELNFYSAYRHYNWLEMRY